MRHVLLGLLLGLCAMAQAATLDPSAPKEWTRLLDQTAQRVETGDLDIEDVNRYLDRLNTLRIEANAQKAAAEIERKEQEELLKVFGPAPGKDAPPERPEVKQQRDKLSSQIALYDSLIKQADLASRRAQDLQSKLTADRVQIVFRSLLRRGPSPLTTDVWQQARDNLALLAQGFQSRIGQPEQHRRFVRFMIGALASVLVAILLGWLIARLLAPRLGLDRQTEAQASVPLRHILARLLLTTVLPFGLSAAGMALAWHYDMGFDHPSTRIALHFVGSLLVGAMGVGIARAAFSPAHPAWRLIPILDGPARRLDRRVGILIAVVMTIAALRQLLLYFLADAPEPQALLANRSTLSDLLLGLLALHCLRGRDWGGGAFWRGTRLLGGLVIFASIGSHLAGYHILGDFLLSRLLAAALLVAALAFLRLLPLALLRTEANAQSGQYRLLNFWIMVGVDLTLITLGLYGLLSILGVPQSELQSLSNNLARGLTIGSLNLSFQSLLLGILVLAAVLALTKLLQRALDRKLLPNTRLDLSARSAVVSFVGYLGLALALLGAATGMGIDLTNIAIVAGALSVGIGFGLQNIVNNFVSGLIIHVERPIRIGDWVTLGTLEGTVKRIGARATEIETFQRASIIVPNAEILQQTVVNWTYSDTLGRVDIPVSVAYDAPIADVEAVLRNCAAANETVLENPGPEVLFMGFGDNALNFELRVHVYDIRNNRVRVASDLRKAILRAFESAGIRIPFPQREVRVVHQKGADIAAVAAAGA